MTLASRLFVELLCVAAMLMSVLFINNIFLYKQKVTDFISLMLTSGMATCLLEILWVVVDGHPRLKALAYLCVCCYCTVFLIFGALLNRYLLYRIGIRLEKKWEIIGYVVPIAAVALLCAASAWTRLLFWVDESGFIQTTDFFDALFQGLVFFYIFSPLLLAVYILTLGKQRRPADAKIPTSLFIFGVIAPVCYGLQLLILGEDMDVFQTTSLPFSLALVYLVTNVSTHNVLDAQAHIEAVEADLRIASKIQADALPSVAPEFADFMDMSLRGSMNTAKEVGGDFFDYFPIDENRLCFLIADVSGKGTPAALFMMTAKTMIKDYALTHDSTSEIFTSVNARLCENNEAGMFATAWIGILDKRTMTLQFTNAGHNFPMLQRRGQPCEEVKNKHGLFLAGMEFTRYKQSEMQLESGDRLLLYTDGVTEAHDRANKLYGEDRLKEMLDSTADCPGEQVLQRIMDDIDVFATGVPQFDDITMVIITIN